MIILWFMDRREIDWAWQHFLDSQQTRLPNVVHRTIYAEDGPDVIAKELDVPYDLIFCFHPGALVFLKFSGVNLNKAIVRLSGHRVFKRTLIDLDADIID